MAPPDFAQIAQHFVDEHGIERLDEWDPVNSGLLLEALAAQLREVWNARGDADANAVEGLLTAADAAIDLLHQEFGTETDCARRLRAGILSAAAIKEQDR